MKKPSTTQIALQLERKEAAACQSFVRASEQAEAKIVAAVESVRPFREKLQRAKQERALFIDRQAAPDTEIAMPGPTDSLSALARALEPASKSILA